MTTEESRYWSKVATGDGCWEWTGARRGRGYGMFWSEVLTVSAHRWMWERTSGVIPARMDVCHRCDNPSCVRPDHLFLGTRAENVQDMDRKGRRACKLTADQAAAIREDVRVGVRVSELMTRYGVSDSAIRDILHGRHWKAA